MPNPLPPPKLQVFLCHSSGDKEAVHALYRRLQTLPWLYPWLDEEELLPGQDWREEIEKAVEQSHIILVCLSPASITKEGFVQREIRVALDRADYIPEGTIYLIPLKLEPCEPPRRLSRWQWVNYYEERGYDRLLKALQVRAEKLGVKLDTSQPIPPVVTAAPPPLSVQPQVEVETPVNLAPRPALLPETEQDQLVRELNYLRTDHKRRQRIGNSLNKIGDTRPGVGVREDGLPDIVWLPVAPGGSLKIEGQNYRVEPFYIAKYQVTYAQYEAFVKAKDGYNNLLWWQDFPLDYQPQKLSAQSNKRLNCPRDRVSWYQSVAFTRWLNQRLRGLKLNYPGNSSDLALVIGENAEVRLPLEWEWQWAAQNGREQWAYPWGDWRDGYANTREAELGQTVAVGMHPQGAAACGALDLSGNLWEWNLNKYSNSGEKRVLRGASCNDLQSYAASAFRFGYYPVNAGYDFGFRLVVSFPIAP